MKVWVVEKSYWDDGERFSYVHAVYDSEEKATKFLETASKRYEWDYDSYEVE
jgi:hypothetical protein